jgi:nucleotide-binding universal stress UspA family protein
MESTMDNAYKKIILAMDPQHSAMAALETVLTLARQHGSQVVIVDTVRPPSRSSLFFSSSAEDVFEIVVADKQNRIRKTCDRFREMGIEAEGKLLYGKSSEAITREAIDCHADLVVRYMKGVQSRYPGLFGNTARNLMRVCPSPLLFVGNRPLENPNILACVNPEHDEAENSVILSESRKLATRPEDVTALYCWNVPGHKFLRPYLSDESFQDTLNESESVFRKLFDRFCEQHKTDAFSTRMLFEQGDAADVIPNVCKHQDIDVVVMSSASQTHPVRRLLGSTIESVLDELPCALMVVKQAGFRSPVRPSAESAGESAAEKGSV